MQTFANAKCATRWLSNRMLLLNYIQCVCVCVSMCVCAYQEIVNPGKHSCSLFSIVMISKLVQLSKLNLLTFKNYLAGHRLFTHQYLMSLVQDGQPNQHAPHFQDLFKGCLYYKMSLKWLIQFQKSIPQEIRVGEDVEKMDPLYTVVGKDVNWCSRYREQCGGFLKS